MIYIATYIRKLKDRSGNYITPATRSKGVYFSSNKTLDDLVFPVGFIYQSTSSTSPASLYGGSWERIQGRFLLGTSSNYTVSSTGGEENVMLTIDTMPNHNHHGTNNGFSFLADLNRKDGDGFDMLATGGQEWKYAAAADTAATGGNKAHNNMPPYYAVNIWRRTA